MTCTLRNYEPGDLESCRELWHELTQRHRDIYNDQTIGGDQPGLQFDTYLARDDLVGPWVAVQEGQVVGLTGLQVTGKEAELEPVVVRKEARGQGLGTRLIVHAKEQALALGVTHLSIRPVGRNIEAIRCFHRAGFSILGRVELFTDLKQPREGLWKSGLELHGQEFRY